MSKAQKRLGDLLPEIYAIHFTDGSYLEMEGSISADLID